MTAASQSAISQQTIDEFVGVAHGNFARVKELLAQHPDLIDVNATWVERPIQAAAHVGSVEIARFLLDHGAPLDLFTAAMLGMVGEVEARSHGALSKLVGGHTFPWMYFPSPP